MVRDQNLQDIIPGLKLRAELQVREVRYSLEVRLCCRTNWYRVAGENRFAIAKDLHLRGQLREMRRLVKLRVVNGVPSLNKTHRRDAENAEAAQRISN